MTNWIYSKENDLELRTCPKCMSTQVKSPKTGEWVIYFTYERILKFHENLINHIEEDCCHGNED